MKNRNNNCDACSMQANGVKSRIAVPHTCGRTDQNKIADGLKNLSKMKKLRK